MKDYAEKTIWIIGASSGIGRALAEELHSRGARVILSARNLVALKELNKKLGALSEVMPLDVQNAEDVQRVAASVFQRMPPNGIVYMAGIYAPMKIRDLDLAHTSQIVATNLLGAIHVVHAVLPAFLRNGGQIALCASVVGYRGLPNAQPYGATKAALINFAESLRAECGSMIDIKLINPGFVKTAMTDKNDFHMPMMIEAPEAARHIADGMLGKSFEIHFPKQFTILMKMLRLIPAWLYFRGVSRWKV